MAETLAASERKAYKAHIKSLEDQLTWMRDTFGTQAAIPGTVPPMESGRLWTSEEEEEARELLNEEIIDQDEYQSMLMAAGALNTDIQFEPTH